MHWTYDVVSNRNLKTIICLVMAVAGTMNLISVPCSTEITEVVSLQPAFSSPVLATEADRNDSAAFRAPFCTMLPFHVFQHYGAERSQKDTLDVCSLESGNCTQYILETIILIEVIETCCP